MCILYKKGKCNDLNCKFSHGQDNVDHYVKIRTRKDQYKNKYTEVCQSLECLFKTQYMDQREEDVDINCNDFVNGKCLNGKSCKLLHNYSLKAKSVNNSEFKNALQNMLNDFKILAPYERKYLGETNLDLAFICDCTGSMDPWLEKTKTTIYSIINFIKENNQSSNVRIGFVGYRDISDGKHRFEILNFTDDVNYVFNFIDDLMAEGGGDIPEDVTGGLIKGLKLLWRSKAKYAILIADAPDHGFSSKHVGEDHYPKGLKDNGMTLAQVTQRYAENEINLYAVKINTTTGKMFKHMSNEYEKIAKRPIHMESLGSCKEKFAFFVAYGASTTLTSVSYSKFDFIKFILSLRNYTMRNETYLSAIKNGGTDNKNSALENNIESNSFLVGETNGNNKTLNFANNNNKNMRSNYFDKLDDAQRSIFEFIKRIDEDLRNCEEEEEESKSNSEIDGLYSNHINDNFFEFDMFPNDSNSNTDSLDSLEDSNNKNYTKCKNKNDSIPNSVIDSIINDWQNNLNKNNINNLNDENEKEKDNTKNIIADQKPNDTSLLINDFTLLSNSINELKLNEIQNDSAIAGDKYTLINDLSKSKVNDSGEELCQSKGASNLLAEQSFSLINLDSNLAESVVNKTESFLILNNTNTLKSIILNTSNHDNEIN